MREHTRDRYTFWNYNDYEISWRLVRYCSLLLCQQKPHIPVRSYVIHLLRDGRITAAPLIMKAPGVILGTEDERLRFWYGCVEVGRMRPQEILRHNSYVLYPFLPLTKSGARLSVVRQMMSLLDGEAHRDIAVVGFLMATLAFKRYNKRDLDRLQREYAHMRDILRETPGYQWIMEAERKDGFEAGLAEGRAAGIELG